MKLSIITPVWNQSALTHRFLFQHYQYYRDCSWLEIIIIDNGSTDNTDAMLRQWVDRWDRLHVISNAENDGFGPANNEGAAFAKGDYLLFINNDVILQGDYLTPLLDALEANPGDIVGPQVLDYDTGWNRFNGKPIPYISGWCIAMHRDIFNHLGSWDERYKPCDYEDIDLCYTAQKEGIKLVSCRLPLTHISGQTGARLPDRLAITRRSQALFKAKWGIK